MSQENRETPSAATPGETETISIDDYGKGSYAFREAQHALDEARRVSRAMRKAFTDRHRNAIRSWARALANLETRTSATTALWTGFEMGIREAMVSMSLDLGWSEDEWDAVEVAAQQMAQKMIEASE
ncbi:hypothetical protein KBX29_03975 [Corynebacterium sp. CCUG 18816]|uniref:hypothetical protein n=1 Tax=Corynebacterium pseudogenitalium TaxID=38303 RepID=UPI00210B8570|nr:hypothetical protein [Corynebacterium pseudogenitalium]MCQ4616005.1 hypothetical protein [Corynebacterium pseudogenitalium]